MQNKNKKRKYGNQRNLYINLHLEEDFGMEFTACLCELMPEAALTPFTACDAYCYFAGRALLVTSQK